MGNDKGTVKKLFLVGIAVAIILFLIVVIAVLVGIIFLLSSENSESSLNDNISINGTSLIDNVPDSVSINGNNPPNPTPPVPTNADLWPSITLPLVEKNCLSAAKVQAGDLAWAVSSCSCTETKTLVEKNYSCAVSAIDGQHNLELDCVKEQGNCVITSEQGNFTFTFQELYQLAS